MKKTSAPAYANCVGCGKPRRGLMIATSLLEILCFLVTAIAGRIWLRGLGDLLETALAIVAVVLEMGVLRAWVWPIWMACEWSCRDCDHLRWKMAMDIAEARIVDQDRRDATYGKVVGVYRCPVCSGIAAQIHPGAKGESYWCPEHNVQMQPSMNEEKS